jgi:hypothetical protein
MLQPGRAIGRRVAQEALPMPKGMRQTKLPFVPFGIDSEATDGDASIPDGPRESSTVTRKRPSPAQDGFSRLFRGCLDLA